MTAVAEATVLNRARSKAYRWLTPLVFFSYVIAYRYEGMSLQVIVPD